jgi:hypothetical protein
MLNPVLSLKPRSESSFCWRRKSGKRATNLIVVTGVKDFYWSIKLTWMLYPTTGRNKACVAFTTFFRTILCVRAFMSYGILITARQVCTHL